MSDLDDLSLTACQLRAARALAGWSQQDLAKEAKVAPSTIADFERGQRAPMANNLHAMRKALELTGIHFLEGGAIKGILPKKTRAEEPRGIPIKWVDATDLEQWSDRRDAQNTLPELLRRLVRATAPKIKRMDFPSGESIQYSGWDGICEVEGETQYVPNGFSSWEIGTQKKGIKGKADTDFKKRTEDPLGIDPRRSTFVFVTSRRWPGKSSWVQSRLREGKWGDVRAYDGNDLDQWLELFPEIGYWLAVRMGKKPPGLRLLNEVWEEWSLSTRPPMSADLVLTDRDEESSRLLKWLYGNPSVMAVQGESKDEAIAFLKASLEPLPPDYRNFFLARCLVVQTPDQVRMLTASSPPLILVLPEADAGLAEKAVLQGHHVYLPYGSDMGVPNGVIRLPRPSRTSFSQSLENMGLLEQEAQKMTRQSACSLAAFRRLFPSVSAQIIPEWAIAEHARVLIPALLVGGWDEERVGDKNVLEKLGRENYDALSFHLNRWALAPDSPLRKVGSTWKIVSPIDAWFLLAPFITRDDLDRFESLTLEVLAASDPRFELEPNERWMASIKQKESEFSELLRRGLVESLILLAVHNDQVKGEIEKATNLPGVIVQKLLSQADKRRWWSISPLLTLLAEAAPEKFLDAVDEGFDLKDSPIMVLFLEDGGPFGSSHHAELLWALEILAWNPQYLGRVVPLLAKMDRLDPGGRFANRPLRTLRNIFLLWMPQTYASLAERLKILERLIKKEPTVAWKLLFAMLPRGHDVGEFSQKPRLRDFKVDRAEEVTFALVAQGVEEISERILTLSGSDLTRWKEILEFFPNFSPSFRDRAIEQLSIVIRESQDEAARFEIWTALRELLNRHRSFPDVGWSLPKEELDRIEQIYSTLEPEDPIQKFSWLFDRMDAAIPHPTGKGWEEDQKLSGELRRATIRQILHDHSIDTVLALARSVQTPGLIGVAVAQAVEDSGIKDAILMNALNDPDLSSTGIVYGLIQTSREKYGPEWSDALLERARAEHWPAERITRILLSLPAEKKTWNWALSFGHEVKTFYWSRVEAYSIKGASENITLALEELLSVHRAHDAVRLAGVAYKGLPGDLLVRVLKEAASVPAPVKLSSNDIVMFQYHIEEILKYLDSADDVSADQLALLEWIYLPILEHSRRPPVVLHKFMSTNPAFFVDVLKVIYKPSEESGVEEASNGSSEQAEARVLQAYALLQSWHRVPGEIDDRTIDPEVLENWVKQVRILCSQSGRKTVGDHYIGRVLAFSPADSDGMWPIDAIRDVIELTRSRDLENGVLSGLAGKIGVTSRGLFDGGIQEHGIAEQYRAWAKEVGLEWPRTASLLERAAERFDQQGKWHDHDAERLEWL